MPSTEFQNIDFGFRYGTQRAIRNAPYNKGTFYVSTDTGELNVDIGGQRISTKDIYVYTTESEIRSLTNPDINKMYYARDTFKLMAYDATNLKWVNAGGSPDEINERIDNLESRVDAFIGFSLRIIDTVEDLPEVGEPGTIYLIPQSDSDEDTLYDEFIWIDSEGLYEKIGITTPELADYYKKSEVDTLIENAQTAATEHTDNYISSNDQAIQNINDEISSINTELGHVRDAITEAAQGQTETDTEINASIQAVQLRMSDLESSSTAADSALDTKIDTKAPINHASSSTTYGIGDANNYGHTKLSDTYSTEEGDASDGLAASQKAVYSAYDILNNNKAAVNHSSTTTDYGTGNSTKYGHVKLSDTYDSLVGAASDAMGASQKSVNDLYLYLSSMLPNITVDGDNVIVDYGDEDEET